MKNKSGIIGLVVLLTLILGNLVYSCEKDVPPAEKISGKLFDWESVPELAAGSGEAANSIRIGHDNEKVYFLILGTDMGPEKQLFIDADNNFTTGYTGSEWTNAGFEYLLENNTLYKSKYNGSNWSWIEIGSQSVERDTSSTSNEIAIRRSAFVSLTGKMKVAYKGQSTSRTPAYLPARDSEAALYVVDSLALTTFEISALAGLGGVIDPPGAIVAQGEDITFLITPGNEDYDIKSVIVDDKNVGAVASYTFEDVQGNHIISASFAKRQLITLSPYLITYGPGTMDLLFRTVDTVKLVNVDWGVSENYGSNSGQLTVDDADGEHRFQYRMSDLLPGQKYFYRVNVDTSSLRGSFFPATGPAGGSFTFYALGDTQDSYGTDDDGIWSPNLGKNEVAHAIYKDVALDLDKRQTFVLYSGDLNDNYQYENWYGCFFNPNMEYASWLNRNMITIATQGNHDGANTDESKFNNFFPLAHTDEITSGGGYYSVDYGPLHVVVIDPYGNLDWSDEGGHPNPGEPQWDWLSEDLRLASENPEVKFIACLYHTSAYSLGEHPDNLPMQNASEQLFEKYGVDICLSGHNHYYGRAFVENIYHLTLGSGGATQSSSKLDPEKPHVSVYEEGTFYTRFTVSGDEMKVEAFEHTGNGEIAQTPVDTFTINASDN